MDQQILNELFKLLIQKSWLGKGLANSRGSWVECRG